MMAEWIVLAVILCCLLVVGCIQSSAPKESNTQSAVSQGAFREDANVNIDDSSIPFIGENDTVEIGQMI